MNVKEKWCKSALTISKLPGIDYSLNPYIGCMHSCIYCYVPYIMHIDEDEWKNNVYIKVNMPSILRNELKRKKRGIVGISTSTDAYQPVEKRYEITRKCLHLLLKNDWAIDILTKSDIVLRDIDLIKKFSNAKVGITVSTINEENLKILEPFASPLKKRLKTLKKFSESGIYTYAFVGPVYPDMEKEDVREFFYVLKDTGIKEIIFDKFHLKNGLAEKIFSALPEGKRGIFKRIYRDYYEEIFYEMKNLCKDEILLTMAFSH
ncbi:MAG TPA: radical SAM protein [Thermoplasmatales archaeon]|nr:radical SAM protein [Thermoplasmatales archaeon]